MALVQAARLELALLDPQKGGEVENHAEPPQPPGTLVRWPSAASWTLALNDRGQVVGQYRDGRWRLRSFISAEGKVRDLGTLGGNETRVAAVNNRGHAVGTSTTSSGSEHAFLWKNGVITDLGSRALDGPRRSAALAINDKGQVVGYSHTRDKSVSGGETPKHAVLWVHEDRHLAPSRMSAPHKVHRRCPQVPDAQTRYETFNVCAADERVDCVAERGRVRCSVVRTT